MQPTAIDGHCDGLPAWRKLNRRTGEMFYWQVQAFKAVMQVGDTFRIYTDKGTRVGYQLDGHLPDWMTFTVMAKYPHCVQLTKTTVNAYGHKYTHTWTPSYTKLYLMAQEAERSTQGQ